MITQEYKFSELTSKHAMTVHSALSNGGQELAVQLLNKFVYFVTSYVVTYNLVIRNWQLLATAKQYN